MNPPTLNGGPIDPGCSDDAGRRRRRSLNGPRPDPGPSSQRIQEQHHPLVLRLARRRGLPAADVKVLVQEVFPRVGRALSQGEATGPRVWVRRWLHRLAPGVIPDRSPEAGRLLPGEKTPPGSGAAGDPGSVPENPHLLGAEADVLQVLLARLGCAVSPKSLQVFHLVTFDGWSAEQVMDRYSMTRRALEARLMRVRGAARMELRRLENRINGVTDSA